MIIGAAFEDRGHKGEIVVNKGPPAAVAVVASLGAEHAEHGGRRGRS